MFIVSQYLENKWQNEVEKYYDFGKNYAIIRLRCAHDVGLE